MPIEPDELSSIASAYTKHMTSIRGRRVQRLLKREFAGAEYVLVAQVGAGAAAVLGLSSSGAALCATDGKGKQASVVKWAHDSTVALETHFDLHKDSLPAVGSSSLPLDQWRGRTLLRLAEDSVPPPARSLASKVLQLLAGPRS